jgi:hypothetical protein
MQAAASTSLPFLQTGLAGEAIDDLAAVAAINGFDKLYGFAGKAIGSSGKAKNRSALADAEEERLRCGGQGSLRDLIGDINPNAIKLGDGLIQRSVRIESFLKIRVKAHGEMRAFDAKRNGIREADAAEEKHFLRWREVKSLGNIGGGTEALEGENPGAGARAARAHFFGEGEDLAKILFQLHAGDKSSLSALAVSEAEAAEGLESLARGHAADAHARGDFLLGRNGLAHLQFAGANLFEEALLNLVVERDNAMAIEGNRRHRTLQLSRRLDI